MSFITIDLTLRFKQKGFLLSLLAKLKDASKIASENIKKINVIPLAKLIKKLIILIKTT